MPRFTFITFCIAAVLFSLTGCVDPWSVGEYERYMDAGLRLEHQGNYAAARRCYIRSRAAASGSFMPADAESAALYNIARMNGMLGYFDIAERQLKEALRLEEKVYGVDGGHASMRWFELARLYFAWGRYPDSVAAYEHAFPLADRLDAQKSDPVTYAACLRDFADALDKAGDSARANQEREKAASIREERPSPNILYYPGKSNP